VLEPGDVLYVPPRFAHNGVAVGDDCMTYSIGFRAPSRAELVAGWSESVLDRLKDDDRYADPDLQPQGNPGEITSTAIDRLYAMVTETLRDRDAFARWFAQHSTAPKNSELDWRPDNPIGAKAVRQAVAGGIPLLRNPASRFSFIAQDNSVELFVDGESFACVGESAELARRLCARERVAVDTTASAATIALIVELANIGSLAFDQPD
jgi:50S ribosomal protein L16 3-hydroxylase